MHIFHYVLTSCSQKLCIFLNLKGIAWESHTVDLFTNENIGDWYLGINPRGLVPTLVHDGIVHIESNDILVYLETAFPEIQLIPSATKNQMTTLLQHEDDLHFDLRALSFRFVFAPPAPPKSPEDLKQYSTAGSGTVRGEKDSAIGDQIDFWDRFSEVGVTDDAARESAAKSR